MRNLEVFEYQWLPTTIFLTAFLVLSCGHTILEYEFDEGLYFEIPEQGTEDFTADNTIYTLDKSMVFDYYHIKNGDTVKVKLLPVQGEFPDNLHLHEDAWDFADHKSRGDSMISHIKITPLDPSLHPDLNPNPSQSLVEMGYMSSFEEDMGFKEYTGLIENEKNVWIHPHRMKFFKILEINPFPFIQAPLHVGHSWEWELKIGQQWGNPKWKTWRGNITNKMTYEIVGTQKLPTALGILDTYVVEAIASSSIGSSSLISYFHDEYGFVKLDYTNIDGSQTVLELVKVVSM